MIFGNFKGLTVILGNSDLGALGEDMILRNFR